MMTLKAVNATLKAMTSTLLTIFALFGLAVTTQGFSATFLPILPLERATSPIRLSLDALLKDPVVLKSPIHDDVEAAKVSEQMRNWESELKSAAGSRVTELQMLIFESQLASAYYFSASEKPNPENLRRCRTAIIQYGRKLARSTLPTDPGKRRTSSEAAKARYAWHAAVAQMQLGGSRSATVTAVAALETHLPHSLLAPTRFLISVAKAESCSHRRAQHCGNPDALRALSADAKRLPAMTAATLLLFIAQVVPTGGPDSVVPTESIPRANYALPLSAAVQRANQLPELERTSVLKAATAIWIQKEGTAINWHKVPFDLSRHAGQPIARAISERIALADWNRDNHAQAIKRYKELARAHDGSVFYAALETRVLDLLKVQAAKTNSTKLYEAELIAARKKLGAAQSFAAALAARHEQLALAAFKLASASNAQKNTQQEGIQIIHNLAAILAKEPSSANALETWNERLAILHALSGNHNAAVKIYLALAQDAKDGARQAHYLTAAIASQRELAHWPSEAPWDVAPPAGYRQARQLLLEIYSRLHVPTEPGPRVRTTQSGPGAGPTGGPNSTAWNLVAHQGWLNINLGHLDTALALFDDQLKNDPRGAHASAAAGYLIASYSRSKAWERLEATCRIALKANLRPVNVVPMESSPRMGTTGGPDSHGAALNTQDFLALALLEGGRNLLATQQFAAAVGKLDEFANTFRSHPRRDEGLLLLGDSLHGAGQHLRSVEVLTALVEQYPASKHMRAALLHGGDYSVPAGFEDAAMFFYQSYLDRFERDAESERVRDTLIALYDGREMYARATRLLQKRFNATHLARELRSAAAVAWIGVEERHGSEQRTQQVAQTILSAPWVTADAKIAAIFAKARSLFAKRDLSGIITLERYAHSLDQSQSDVTEARGLLRFLAAEIGASAVKYDLNPLSVKDATAALNSQYAAFWSAKTAYEGVCALGQSSYCAPAHFRMARLSEIYVEWLQDLKIAETLDQKTVKLFRDRKQAIISGLTDLIESSDGRALALVTQGNTTPDWTDEILWQNSADWNFDRVSGDTGSGYVQFRPHLSTTAMRKEK